MAGGQQNPTDIAEGTFYEGSRTMKDLTLSEAVNEAISVAPDVISIFHTRIAIANRAVKVILKEWSGPVMVYPDAGRQSAALAKWHNHSIENEESVEDYIDAAKAWVDQGVQIVGACCEFGVQYIEPLRQAVPKKISVPR
jgi:S-methylmethionine-dependent homocysteine/selenocysteine methylase